MNNYTIINNTDITSNISDGAFRLYCILTSMAYGNKTECYPSISYLATKLRRSCRTINRYIKALKQNRLIDVRRRGSISSVYTILSKQTKNVAQKVTDVVKRAYNASKDKIKTNKSKTGTFNNFKQRKYDFKKLEDLLLGNKKGELSDCLLE